jgi:plasmid stabilization system protein ParE
MSDPDDHKAAMTTDEIVVELGWAQVRTRNGLMTRAEYEQHPFTRAVNEHADLEVACTAYRGELELIAEALGAESPAQIRDCIQALRRTCSDLLSQVESGYDRRRYTERDVAAFEASPANLLIIDLRASTIMALRAALTSTPGAADG